jgi:hypothetical protein
MAFCNFVKALKRFAGYRQPLEIEPDFYFIGLFIKADISGKIH